MADAAALDIGLESLDNVQGRRMAAAPVREMAMVDEAKFKVLLAGYDPDSQTMFKEALSPLGCQIITASSVALALFLTQKNLPCLVVVSARGLGDEVVDLVSDIKADEEFESIEIVVTVNGKHDSLKNAAMQAGALKCLSEDSLDLLGIQRELRPLLYTQDKYRLDQTPE